MTVPARSATEFAIKGKAEEKTEWQKQNESGREGKRKRNGTFVGAAGISKELAE